MIRIVLVDDEKSWLEIIKAMLESTFIFDMEVKTFSDPQEALFYIKSTTIDCVISDYLIPGHISGLDLYHKIQGVNKDIKFILISNSKIPTEKIKDIVQQGIVYLPKSFLVVKNFMKKNLEEILIT